MQQRVSTEPMTNGKEGMIQKHTGAGPAHDATHLFAHFCSVAVNRTASTGRLYAFSLEMWTMIQTKAGISQQTLATRATTRRVVLYPVASSSGVVAAAIEGNHAADHGQFARSYGLGVVWDTT